MKTRAGLLVIVLAAVVAMSGCKQSSDGERLRCSYRDAKTGVCQAWVRR